MPPSPTHETPALHTLEQALASGGNLSSAEKRSLLAPVLRSAAAYLIGRLRKSLGLRPERVATLALDRLRWPDTKLAREAERECHATLSAPIVNHSYRSFVFGLALAGLDGIRVDEELLYVTSLLHDLALEAPTPGRCFAVVGAQRAQALALAAGADVEAAAQIAEGVALHITPGIGFERGPLAPLVAAGALVDLIGMRLSDVQAELVRAAHARWPRAQCGHHVAACWRRESRAVPHGRAALVERVSAFSFFVRHAPFDA